MNKNLKISKIGKNIYFGIATRLVITVLGLVIPRLFIVSFGSETNGLLATVTQIFTYLALMEAGIGNSAINALYKPLAEKDIGEANAVLTDGRRYYRKVSVFYALGVIAFSVIYPFVSDASIDKKVIFGIIILQGAGSFIGYYFTAIYSHLLAADGKRYVNENFGFFAYVATALAKILVVYLGGNVLMVQLFHFLITLVKAPIVIGYCRKKYAWIDFSIKPSEGRLKERGAFIVHEFSSAVFNNTDIFLISVFCSLAAASVYSVYNSVFSALVTLLTTVNGSLSFILGQSRYGDKDRFEKTYDMYSLLYTGACFVCFTTAAVLAIPFVKLYTNGVTDADYVLPAFSLLFVVVNLLSSSRAVASVLINVSGHAGKTQVRSITESAINLVASIILVQFFGIYGVLGGTVVAMLYRSNDMIIYANKKVLGRSPLREYVNLLSFIAAFVLLYVLFDFIEIEINSYGALFLAAIVTFIGCTVMYAAIAIGLNLKLFNYWLGKIKKRS